MDDGFLGGSFSGAEGTKKGSMIDKEKTIFYPPCNGDRDHNQGLYPHVSLGEA